MKKSPPRGMSMAIGMAVLMHLLLFAVARPSGSPVTPSAPVPPPTRYAMPASEGEGANVVRIVKSPVLFSLPSGPGFSSELLANDVKTRRTITPLPVRSEHFLEAAPTVYDAGDHLRSGQLMISAAVRGPRLPDAVSGSGKPYAAAKRVFLAPELDGRLVGGVVLPPDLNQAVERPWEVRASISISEQGVVEHVFLDQPLDSAALNQEVLRVLYNLRFKSGPALESSIEIYSAGTGNGGEK